MEEEEEEKGLAESSLQKKLSLSRWGLSSSTVVAAIAQVPPLTTTFLCVEFLGSVLTAQCITKDVAVVVVLVLAPHPRTELQDGPAPPAWPTAVWSHSREFFATPHFSCDTFSLG